MGSIMAIDVGIVLVSITIFDRENKLFPKKIIETGKTSSLLTENSYFDIEQSFYSTKHGGTFHFAHFNIHYFKNFLESKAFQAIMDLIDDYKDENMALILIRKLSHLKMVSEEPISPKSKTSKGSILKKESLKPNEEEKQEEEKKEEDDEAENSKVGGGFPSLNQLEKIKKKYGVVKDLDGLQLL
jgi:hypothetical protein